MKSESARFSSGSDASSDAPFEYDEVEVSVSDLHPSAGKVLPVRVKHTLRYKVVRVLHRICGNAEPPDVVEIPNPLEVFEYDVEFAAFLEKIVEMYGGARVLRLRLNGDCFDPLAVTWYGKIADPEYEVVGVCKMRRIIRGHPVFFGALEKFLRLPNAALCVSVGNHDQFLCWPRVQRTLALRLMTGGSSVASRLRFIDQSTDFTDVHRGVEYCHGMNAEAHNRIDPRTTILYTRFGMRLRRPVLNKPLGSEMTVGLANPIAMRNAHVGKMRIEKDIWRYASHFRWLWGVFAGFKLAWMLLVGQIKVFSDFRRRTGLSDVMRMMFGKLRATLAVVLSTAQHNPVDKFAEKTLRERDGSIRVLVMGHSHHPCRITSAQGTYINTGTWSKQLRLVYPTFECRWSRFRTLELAWRTLRHFLRTGQLAFMRQFLKLLAFVAIASAMFAFLLTSFQQNRFHVLSYDLLDFKLPVGILLGFFLVGGFFRIFSVKPDVVDDTRFTFSLVRHGRDGGLKADLMEYLPKEDAIRDYV
jgi:hypothetical protein